MGLHRYRYPAYACWAVFCILIPSLAFVNPVHDGAYVSSGTFCYLPVRPIWYRLVLSWVPRYLILCSILAIYVTIYIYTKSRFGKFDTNLTNSSTSGEPLSSGGTDQGQNQPKVLSSPFRWRNLFGRSAGHCSVLQTTGEPAPTISKPCQQRAADPATNGIIRTPTLLEALRDKTLIPLRHSWEPKDTTHTLRKRHKAIQRQLRYMFIYPMVYLLIWLAPFINHCYFYTRQHDPPFVLNCFAVACVSLQCTVDCLIFSIREKPWRNGTDGHSTSRGRRQSSGTGSYLGMVPLAVVQKGRASVIKQL